MIPSLKSVSYTAVGLLALCLFVGIDPAAAQTVVIDDGDAEYSTTGDGWMLQDPGGAFGTFEFVPAEAGGIKTAEWTATGLTAGFYRVSVTWEAFTNRAVDAPFTVLDGATELETVDLNQTVAPDDLSEDFGDPDGEVVWEDLGFFQLTGTTLTVRLSNDATPVGGFVVADAVRIELVPDGPEVSVSVDGTGIAAGTGSVDFGFAIIGVPVTKTITVKNVGNEDLSLGPITIPTDFSLASDFGSTLLTPGQTTDFVVQMDAVEEGAPSGVVSFVTNDADENPFDFNVSGIVSLLPPAVTVIDDGDAEYITTGGWNMTTSGTAFGGDFDYIAAAEGGTETADWTGTGLVAGLYSVSVTWEEFTNRAVDSPYTVLDGVTPLGTVTVDQTVAPAADFVEDGVDFEELGSFELTGDTLTVRLSNDATPGDPDPALVIADAVRLERTSTPPAVTITAPVGGESAIAGTPVDLIATADDAEDGDLTAAIEWTSDLDGALGPGGSLTLTDLSVGEHTLTATAIDGDGLDGNDSVTFTIFANAAPTVTITSPLESGSATEGTPVDLIATAIDPEDGDLTADIVWTSNLDGALGPGGSLTLTDLSVGEHTLTATATDSLDLPGNDSVTFTIVANAAPIVSITSPADGGSATEGTSVDLIATADDAEDGDLTAAIEWTSDLDGALGPGGSLTLTDLSVGEHTLTATATDGLGLSGDDSVTFTIVANAAPIVSITSPADGGSATAGTSVDLIATADDAEDGDLTAGIDWTSDLDGPLGTGGSLALTTLQVGEHTLTATAIDGLGLDGGDSVTFTIVANAAPTVSITSPADGGSATEGTPVDLIATADDAEDGDLTAGIDWTSDLDGPLGTGGSLTLTDLSVGEHTLTATAIDGLGLDGDDSVIFSVPEPAAAASSAAALTVVLTLAAVRRERSRTDVLGN